MDRDATKSDLVKHQAKITPSDSFFVEFERYINTFPSLIKKKKRRKVTNEKDRSSGNKTKRHRSSL